MGSATTGLRARKFFKEVSKAKLIDIGRRNSPDWRALLQCILGYSIKAKLLVSKGYAIKGKISLSFA